MAEQIATITYLGHSTVLLVGSNGKRIMIDPWLDGNPSCPEHLRNPGAIDYICLTHGHGDHTGSATVLAKQTGATVFATFELCSILANEGVIEENLQRMNKGGTVQLRDLGVTLTHALHSSSYDTADGRAIYAGEPCGVVLHLPGGTIYHAGDTALFSDMELIGKSYRPAVALLPIGDRFTMGPREAAVAAGLIKAKTVIPIHHSTFPALSGTPAEFEAMLRKEAPGIECKVMAPGESFQAIR